MMKHRKPCNNISLSIHSTPKLCSGWEEPSRNQSRQIMLPNPSREVLKQMTRMQTLSSTSLLSIIIKGTLMR